MRSAPGRRRADDRRAGTPTPGRQYAGRARSLGGGRPLLPAGRLEQGGGGLQQRHYDLLPESVSPSAERATPPVSASPRPRSNGPGNLAKTGSVDARPTTLLEAIRALAGRGARLRAGAADARNRSTIPSATTRPSLPSTWPMSTRCAASSTKRRASADLGQYDRAIMFYEEVLRLDRYNTGRAAWDGGRHASTSGPTSRADYDESPGKRMLTDVMAAWATPIPNQKLDFDVDLHRRAWSRIPA